MSAFYDFGWLLLFLLIFPLWIVVALGTLVIVLLRNLYTWARSTATPLPR
jgi:hypothetical protein